MGGSKLSDEDQEFIIKLASQNKSLAQIKLALEKERNITLGSRQTIKNVIDKHTKKPGQQARHEPAVIHSDPGEMVTLDENEPGGVRITRSHDIPESSTPTSFSFDYSTCVVPVSTDTIYAAFLSYCRRNAPDNDILKSLLKNSVNRKRSWRSLITHVIDALIQMGVITSSNELLKLSRLDKMDSVDRLDNMGEKK